MKTRLNLIIVFQIIYTVISLLDNYYYGTLALHPETINSQALQAKLTS